MNTDIVVIGAGIVGLSTALSLQTVYPDLRICVLEKEAGPTMHQSRRNSGVIHAGVYYKPGSLKARFCKEGQRATEDFCTEHKINFERPGKLIVATNERETENLAVLHDRATQNGVEIERLSREELRKAEPSVEGEAALFSPSTGIVNYGEIAEKFAALFQMRGGDIRYRTAILRGRETNASVMLETNCGPVNAGFLVSCAGLHADRVIRQMGIEPDFQIIPFRGEFFEITGASPDFVRHLIYPVPDPDRPFLGVHITRKVSGALTVGPNAVLAFKREGYALSDFFPTRYGGCARIWRVLAHAKA